MKDRKPKVSGVVATVFGWVNPATGELLVSMKNLPDAVEWDKRTNTFGDVRIVSDIIDASEAVLDSVVNEPVPEPIEPVVAPVVEPVKEPEAAEPVKAAKSKTKKKAS